MSKLGDLLRAGATTGPKPASPELPAQTAKAVTPSAAPATHRPPPKVGTHEWYAGRASYGVPHSAELERIAALPRRKAFSDHTPEELEAMVVEETARYARPGGTMRLKPVQAFALRELRTVGGLLGTIEVGGGKTLISLLAPTALGAKRPLLLVKADLRAKLWDVDYPRLVKHWRIPHLKGHPITYADQDVTLEVASYEELSTDRGVELFDRLRPDVVAADEAHTLAPVGFSTRSKRWHVAAKKYRPKFVPLTGTLLTRSVKQGSKLGFYALGNGSPYPTSYEVLEQFSLALDHEEDEACDPGALRQLARDDDEPIKTAFARRVVETPGVVATRETALSGIGLNFCTRPLKLDTDVSRQLDVLRQSWVTPGEEELSDDLAFSRAARQLAAGFYYVRTWPQTASTQTQRAWLSARKAWAKEVRNFLQHRSRKGVDSEARYEAAVTRGEIPSTTFEDWAAIREVVMPGRKAVWISDFLVADAVRFGCDKPSIIWYSHDAVGRRIAEIGNFPLYEGGEKASAAILHESGSRTIVASQLAHGTGKDLTAFSRQLITTPSSSGKTWEQLLGRTQREGQRAETVYVYVYVHTSELLGAVSRAIKNARWMSEINNGADQRILKATFEFDVPEV